MSPSRLPHPGRFLAGELKARGRSQQYFAALIEKTPEELDLLLNGECILTLDWAMRIAHAL